MQLSNAEYMRSLLCTCPFVSAEADGFYIDSAGDAPIQYSISSDPEPPLLLKRYLSGDSLKRYAFTLRAVLSAQDDSARAQNRQNFERLGCWLDLKTKQKALPPMGAGACPKSVQATHDALFEPKEDQTAASYTMQFELIYFQKAGTSI